MGQKYYLIQSSSHKSFQRNGVVWAQPFSRMRFAVVSKPYLVVSRELTPVYGGTSLLERQYLHRTSRDSRHFELKRQRTMDHIFHRNVNHSNSFYCFYPFVILRSIRDGFGARHCTWSKRLSNCKVCENRRSCFEWNCAQFAIYVYMKFQLYFDIFSNCHLLQVYYLSCNMYARFSIGVCGWKNNKMPRTARSFVQIGTYAHTSEKDTHW